MRVNSLMAPLEPPQDITGFGNNGAQTVEVRVR